MFSSISSLGDTSSYTGPAGGVGPTLACPSVSGEYTTFLREQMCITRSPVRNPTTVKTIAVTTTPTETAAVVDRVGERTAGGGGQINIIISRELV